MSKNEHRPGVVLRTEKGSAELSADEWRQLCGDVERGVLRLLGEVETGTGSERHELTADEAAVLRIGLTGPRPHEGGLARLHDVLH